MTVTRFVKSPPRPSAAAVVNLPCEPPGCAGLGATGPMLHKDIMWRAAARSGAENVRQPTFEGFRDRVVQLSLAQPLDQSLEETVDHETRRHVARQPARHQVEELLAVDLGDRGG